MNLMRSYCLLFMLVGVMQVQAQQKSIDSLEQRLTEVQTKKERIKVLHALSVSFLNSDLLKALNYSNEAIELAEKSGYDSLIFASWLNQGNIYLQLGNYSRALEHYQKVLKGLGDQEMNQLTAQVYGNIGSVYYYRANHHEALKFYLRAIHIFSDSTKVAVAASAPKRAAILSNMGIIYEERQRYDSALMFYEEALALTKRLNLPDAMANTLNNLGTLYRDQGEDKKALDFYMQALEMRQKNDNQLGIARSYHNIGSFYFDNQSDSKKAEEYLTNATELGRKVGSWQTVSSASQLLHQVYAQHNDYKKAYEMLMYNRQVNDSLFNKESTRKTTELEMQAEFDRQQAMLQAAQERRELNFLLFGVGLVSLLVMVSLLFILQRSKTKRVQVEQENMELERQNLHNNLLVKDRELATNIMYLLNKNELIDQLSDKLLSIKGQIPDQSRPALQKVIVDLQSNLQPELWQEFEYRFQQVHEQFFTILNERFPLLSPSERRLCAFLKLDMTTKEISAITHQNAKSIDVARTRLRKKLNLTGTDQNLVSFLVGLGTMKR